MNKSAARSAKNINFQFALYLFIGSFYLLINLRGEVLLPRTFCFPKKPHWIRFKLSFRSMGDVYGNLKAYKLERRSNAAGLVRTSRTILESETFPIKIQMWRRTQSKRLNESPNDFSAFSRDQTELLGLLSPVTVFTFPELIPRCSTRIW